MYMLGIDISKCDLEFYINPVRGPNESQNHSSCESACCALVLHLLFSDLSGIPGTVKNRMIFLITLISVGNSCDHFC